MSCGKLEKSIRHAANIEKHDLMDMKTNNIHDPLMLCAGVQMIMFWRHVPEIIV